jgi:hypothetical protein
VPGGVRFVMTAGLRLEFAAGLHLLSARKEAKAEGA